jgi:hypothetical protein
MRDGTPVLGATTRYLFAAVSAVWAIVALLLLTRVVGVGQVEPRVVTVVAVLMLANALGMGLLAWWVLRRRKLIDTLAVGVVMLNVAATVADEIGIPDLLYLALSLALLVSLLWSIRALRTAPLKGGDTSSPGEKTAGV